MHKEFDATLSSSNNISSDLILVKLNCLASNCCLTIVISWGFLLSVALFTFNYNEGKLIWYIICIPFCYLLKIILKFIHVKDMSLHFTTKHLSTIKICLCVYVWGGGWTYIPYNKQIFYNTVENANNYNWRIFN